MNYYAKLSNIVTAINTLLVEFAQGRFNLVNSVLKIILFTL